jgi:surface protein
MSYMFSNSSVESLGLANWDTSSLENTTGMFYRCSNLEALDIAPWNLSNLKQANFMFCQCDSLNELDTEAFLPANLIQSADMFTDCPAYVIVDPASSASATIDTSRLQKIGSAFITSIKVESGTYEPSNAVVVDLSRNQDCGVVAWCDDGELVISTRRPGVKVVAPGDSTHLFSQFHQVEYIDLVDLDTSHVTSMCCMFEDCGHLETVDAPNFDTHNVTDMAAMFRGCERLKHAPLTLFDTHNVQSSRL